MFGVYHFDVPEPGVLILNNSTYYISANGSLIK